MMKHFNVVVLLLALIVTLSPGLSYNLKKIKSLDVGRNARSRLQSTASSSVPCSFPERTSKLRKILQQKELSDGRIRSATYGFPDMGQVTATEMINSARTIGNSLKSIPCVGDGDTGYGNVLNIHRTVLNYAQAGMSSIMIEDQLSPKRCGHTPGKEVVSREEAFNRIQAAVDARDEYKKLHNVDILILARTDARIISLEEAIYRCQMFREIGVDWTFLEAPKTEDEMYRYCQEVSGPKLANMLEYGHTPILPPKKLQEIGYTVAAYPLTLLSASAKAMRLSLELLKHGQSTEDNILSFEELKEAVGFPEFYQLLNRYNQK